MSEHGFQVIDTKTKGLILADAIDSGYSADQIEVTSDLHVLEDGNVAYLVNVYGEIDDDFGYPDRVLLENNCYYATVVGNKVYGNEELDALVWEYTTVERQDMNAKVA